MKDNITITLTAEELDELIRACVTRFDYLDEKGRDTELIQTVEEKLREVRREARRNKED